MLAALHFLTTSALRCSAKERMKTGGEKGKQHMLIDKTILPRAETETLRSIHDTIDTLAVIISHFLMKETKCHGKII